MNVDSVNNRTCVVSTKSSTKIAAHEKAEAVIDSICIADRYANIYCKKSYMTNYANSAVGVLAIAVPFQVWMNKYLNSKLKSSTVTNYALISLPLMALLWGYIADKNGKNNAIAQKTGYYKALSKDLSKTTSYAILNQEQEREFKDTDSYKKIKSKHFNSKLYGFLDLKHVTDISKMKHLCQKYKNATNTESHANSKSDVDYVLDICNVIDSKAKKNESKITQGLNLLYAAISGTSLIFLAILNKISKSSSKNQILNKISLIVTLIPMFILGNISSRPTNQDIQNFSKYTAMNDLKSELSGNGNTSELDKLSIISSFKYYLDNRKYSRQKIKQDTYKIKLKNLYKDNVNLSPEQIRDAEQLKNGFQKAMVIYLEDEEKDKISFRRSFLKDFLINVSIVPYLLLTIQSLIVKNRKLKDNYKNLMKASGILLSISVINALLTKYMYKTSEK